jgi:hypothetical protein
MQHIAIGGKIILDILHCHLTLMLSELIMQSRVILKPLNFGKNTLITILKIWD